MSTLVQPFQAIVYSAKNRKKISELAVSDLDSAQSIWGNVDSTFSFRNVLVGSIVERGSMWQAWLGAKETELLEDPAYFIVQHQCEIHGKKIDRWSLVASVNVLGTDLLIHEDVFPDGVERARQSMEACEGDLAPIFVGCEEVTGKKLRTLLKETAAQSEQLLVYRESALSLHTLWICKDEARQKQLTALFHKQKLFLLDGHHRLAAARENYKQGLGDGHLMASICSMEAEDTLILPFHRSVFLERWMLPDRFLSDLSSAGCKWSEILDWTPESLPKILQELKPNAISCLALHAHTNCLLEISLPKTLPLPAPLQGLSLAHLELILQKNVPKATIIPAPEEKIVLEQLALDQAQVGFFLPPLRPEQVQEVAAAGIKLPKKSTRFVPKPALGLVCRPWT